MQVKFPNTPGVKVVEKSLLPPSIVQVSTAVPVFLGYTQNGTAGEAFRITSFKEYADNFGGAKKYAFDVTVDVNDNYTATKPVIDYFFYEAIRLYFINGGGPCYILPLEKNTPGTISALDFTDQIPKVAKLDEPTLIVFPEATNLDASDYGSVVQSALDLCNDVQDKFVLVDSQSGANLIDSNSGALTDLRNVINSNLSYGAAYFPSLETVVKLEVDEANINLTGGSVPGIQTAAYAKLLTAINDVANAIIPPSPLMAGVYAKVDRESGVWKAPANVALQGVIQPNIPISDADQENLNIDATSGKSINAIREFRGKGTLVWGARTLDGNNNEWRYIQVRRLFITVEESVKKATSQFVFENNDAKTWVKVSSMISSYLNGLWKDGALTGATPEEAYFVQVGLGTTMTQQDILEGKMIVKIGLAAVRPAEFIILEFSHFVNQ